MKRFHIVYEILRPIYEPLHRNKNGGKREQIRCAKSCQSYQLEKLAPRVSKEFGGENKTNVFYPVSCIPFYVSSGHATHIAKKRAQTSIQLQLYL